MPIQRLPKFLLTGQESCLYPEFSTCYYSHEVSFGFLTLYYDSQFHLVILQAMIKVLDGLFLPSNFLMMLIVNL